MDTQLVLKNTHKYLINEGFDYHSFSVIFKDNDGGFKVVFMSNVKEKVTKEVRSFLNIRDIDYIFVG